jgi:hypothetical protein
MSGSLEYLVTYGRGGFLGRFRAASAFGRDDQVVVRSERGVEFGIVMGEAGTIGPDRAGDVLRRATADDVRTSDELRLRAANILADAQALAESTGLPLLFLDGEILIDGREAILQAVHWGDCDATHVFEKLSTQHGLPVKLADLTTTPKPAPKGCETCGAEKSGCSSCGTGGGCSTGSCSSGAVKSADELTTYFAGLRKQMEATSGRTAIYSQ